MPDVPPNEAITTVVRQILSRRGPMTEAAPADTVVARGGGEVFADVLFRQGAAGRVATLKERYGLDEAEALAALTTVQLYQQIYALTMAPNGAAGPAEAVSARSGGCAPPVQATVHAALEFLARPAVAAAVLAEAGAHRDGSPIALGLFAGTTEPLAPRAARPALRWLRATAYERLGDLEQAEANLQAAESLDPSWAPTLVSLARYASDRGDAKRGLALLRRAGVPPDDELVKLLERFYPVPPLPLAERAEWLYAKAVMTLADGAYASLVIDTAKFRARYGDVPDPLLNALRDELVCDAVLFEGGAFAGFVASRGSLLPADERMLADRWLLAERSVHEVLEVARGRGCTLRDVRTGTVHHIPRRAGGPRFETGRLYCARVVPAGDTMRLVGGIEPVALRQRDQLIALLDDDPGPVELVAMLSRPARAAHLRAALGQD